jgi:serine/threonine protein kinase
MHRDLKLENWLLQDESERVLKLIDFGLSKFFQRQELMTQSVGSFYYVVRSPS